MLKNTIRKIDKNIETIESFDDFKKIMKQNFTNVFQKFNKNKLIISILYSFNIVSDQEFQLFYNLFYKYKKKGINDTTLIVIIQSSLLAFISLKILIQF